MVEWNGRKEFFGNEAARTGVELTLLESEAMSAEVELAGKGN
jgi:hypothetical protein